MRREELYLRDIVEAADAVERFITDVNEEKFIEDEMRQSRPGRAWLPIR